ncbi:hypothetical protein DSO57_1009745 [Entomophthora muscae]|uniref:Uncharacterized protein n=1 Tax=Entomophthora muscae TaxID=34485 RepID=A0ACC2UTC3_9FUNG|nr:hypothetical protein DSO57_1009745 [Entomophthora muscae]
MKAPPTPNPDCLPPSPDLSLPTASQYAGIAYITLAGLVDTMVPSIRPWALIGQSSSYLIKLAPLLWWAIPSSQQSKLAAKANGTPTGIWYPDIWALPSEDFSVKISSLSVPESLDSIILFTMPQSSEPPGT